MNSDPNLLSPPRSPAHKLLWRWYGGGVLCNSQGAWDDVVGRAICRREVLEPSRKGLSSASFLAFSASSIVAAASVGGGSGREAAASACSAVESSSHARARRQFSSWLRGNESAFHYQPSGGTLATLDGRRSYHGRNPLVSKRTNTAAQISSSFFATTAAEKESSSPRSQVDYTTTEELEAFQCNRTALLFMVRGGITKMTQLSFFAWGRGMKRAPIKRVLLWPADLLWNKQKIVLYRITDSFPVWNKTENTLNLKHYLHQNYTCIYVLF